MARAYSDDLRRKFLEAHEQGEGSLTKLAERFHVSVVCYVPKCRLDRVCGDHALHDISTFCSRPRWGRSRRGRGSSRRRRSQQFLRNFSPQLFRQQPRILAGLFLARTRGRKSLCRSARIFGPLRLHLWTARLSRILRRRTLPGFWRLWQVSLLRISVLRRL